MSVVVYNAKTGVGQRVDESVAAELVRSGEWGFREGQTVNLADADGIVYEADAQAGVDKLASGELGAATVDQVEGQAYQQEYGGVKGAVVAGAAGVARGVTEAMGMPGGFDSLASGLGWNKGTGDTLRRLRADHDIVSIGGEVVGQVAGTLAGGAPGRAAMAAERALVGGSTSLARRAAAMGAVGAAEGAYSGFSNAVTEDVLRSKPLTAESVWSAMGAGALLGGVVGGGVGAAAGAAKKLKGARSLKRAESEELAAAVGAGPPPPKDSALRDALFGDDGSVNKAYAKVASVMSGVDAKTIREMGPLNLSTAGKARRAAALGAGDQADDAVRRVTADLDELNKSSRAITQEVVDADLKRSHVASRVADGDTATAVVEAQKQLDAVRGQLDRIAADVDSFGKSGSKVAKDLRKYVDEVAPTLRGDSGADDAASVFIALDRTKRALQKRVKLARSGATRSQDALKGLQGQRLADALEAPQEQTRQMLMDERLFGTAGANQRRINAAWQSFLDRSGQFEGQFFRRNRTDYDGRMLMDADSDRVQRYVGKLGTGKGELDQRIVAENLAARRELLDAIGDSLDLPPEKLKALRQARESTERIERSLADTEAVLGEANKLRAMGEGQEGIGAMTAGAVGAGIGSVTGGLGVAAVSLASNPARAARMLAQLERATEAVGKRMDGGLSRFFAKHAGKPPKVGRPRLPKKGRVPKGAIGARLFVDQDEGESNRDAYQRHAAAITARAANPVAYAGATSAMLGDLANVAPETSAHLAARAMTAQRFLHEKLPAGLIDASSILDPSTEYVSDAEVSAFARYVNAVMNPLGVLDELERGTLAFEHVEALKATTPELYKELQTRAFAMVTDADEPPPYSARVMLDLLLDLGGAGDPSLAPDRIAKTQERYAAIAQMVQEQQPAPKPAPQVAHQYATATEGATARLAGA